MPIGVALNGRPTYVASTSLTDPRWAGTSVLTGDIAAAIGEYVMSRTLPIAMRGASITHRDEDQADDGQRIQRGARDA